MTKLDIIEAHTKLQRGWADSEDAAWLIARVHKLESALRHIAKRDAPTGERAAEIEHLHVVAAEALKEG